MCGAGGVVSLSMLGEGWARFEGVMHLPCTPGEWLQMNLPLHCIGYAAPSCLEQTTFTENLAAFDDRFQVVTR
eukprot:284920-Chlamydomonas_euryale.AAC.4